MQDSNSPDCNTVIKDNVGRYSLWQVLKLLNPEQLFAVIIISLTLIGVLFGAGFKYLAKHRGESDDLSRIETREASPPEDRLTALEEKERFLLAYLNLLSAKYRNETMPSPANKTRVAGCTSTFKKIINEMTNQGYLITEISNKALEAKKRETDRTFLTVTFTSDNSFLLLNSDLILIPTPDKGM